MITVTDLPQGLTDRAIAQAFLRGDSMRTITRRHCRHHEDEPWHPDYMICFCFVEIERRLRRYVRKHHQ